MLRIARTSAKSVGLDSIMEFRENNTEKLDLSRSIPWFDAILFIGLTSFPNPQAALAGMIQRLFTKGRQTLNIRYITFHESQISS